MPSRFRIVPIPILLSRFATIYIISEDLHQACHGSHFLAMTIGAPVRDMTREVVTCCLVAGASTCGWILNVPTITSFL